MAVTVGVGLTVIVYVLVVPEQLLANGVIVTIALIGELVPLVAVNDGTLPEPLAPKPTLVLLLAQEYVVPDTGLLNVVAPAVAPLQ